MRENHQNLYHKGKDQSGTIWCCLHDLPVVMVPGEVELPDLDQVVFAVERLPRELGREGVVVVLEREGREVPLRVSVLVDPDVVAGDGVVAAHLDDGLCDPGPVPRQLIHRERLVPAPGLIDHLLQRLGDTLCTDSIVRYRQK